MEWRAIVCLRKSIREKRETETDWKGGRKDGRETLAQDS